MTDRSISHTPATRGAKGCGSARPPGGAAGRGRRCPARRDRSGALVPGPGAGRFRQDGAADPARAGAARPCRPAGARRRDHVHPQGGRRNARARRARARRGARRHAGRIAAPGDHAQTRAGGAGTGRASRLATLRPSGAPGGVDDRRAVGGARPRRAGGQRPRRGAAHRRGCQRDVRRGSAFGARRRRRPTTRPGRRCSRIATTTARRSSNWSRRCSASASSGSGCHGAPRRRSCGRARAHAGRRESKANSPSRGNTLAAADWASLAPLAAAAADFLEASGGGAPALVEALAALGRTAAPPPARGRRAAAVAGAGELAAAEDAPDLRRQVNVESRIPAEGPGRGQRRPGGAQRVDARVAGAPMAARRRSPERCDLVRGLPPRTLRRRRPGRSSPR